MSLDALLEEERKKSPLEEYVEQWNALIKQHPSPCPVFVDIDSGGTFPMSSGPMTFEITIKYDEGDDGTG